MTDRLTLITSLREREAGERNHYLAGTEIVEWNVEPKAARAVYWHGLERNQEYEMNIESIYYRTREQQVISVTNLIEYSITCKFTYVAY